MQPAIEWGDISIIKVLLAAGANVNDASLITALKKHDHELAEILVNAGADTNNPRARLTGKTALHAAVKVGDLSMTAKLLDYGADPQDTSAIGAAAELEIELLLNLFVESHSKRHPRGRKEFGSNVLFFPIENGNIALVRKMLRRKADCNAFFHYVDGLRMTPFGHAIFKEGNLTTSFVDMLLQEGLCQPDEIVRETSKRDFKPRQCPRLTALLAAVETRNPSTMQKLIRHGAKVNLPARGTIKRTPLQRAAEIRSEKMVQLPFKQGAEFNATAAQRSRGTALQFSAIRGYAFLFETFLSHGVDVDAPGSRVIGRTALEYAAENGNLDTVKILLNVGAASEPVHQSQIASAMALAKKKGYLAVYALLESHTRTSGTSHVPQETGNADSIPDGDGCETIIRILPPMTTTKKGL